LRSRTKKRKRKVTNPRVVFRERVEVRGGQFLMMKVIELKKNQTYGSPGKKPRGNRLKRAWFASG
jgi:predicted SprT family Zn-dependent metalloprotease